MFSFTPKKLCDKFFVSILCFNSEEKKRSIFKSHISTIRNNWMIYLPHSNLEHSRSNSYNWLLHSLINSESLSMESQVSASSFIATSTQQKKITRNGNCRIFPQHVYLLSKPWKQGKLCTPCTRKTCGTGKFLGTEVGKKIVENCVYWHHNKYLVTILVTPIIPKDFFTLIFEFYFCS